MFFFSNRFCHVQCGILNLSKVKLGSEVFGSTDWRYLYGGKFNFHLKVTHSIFDKVNKGEVIVRLLKPRF